MYDRFVYFLYFIMALTKLNLNVKLSTNIRFMITIIELVCESKILHSCRM